jgi:hypothetical protein
MKFFPNFFFIYGHFPIFQNFYHKFFLPHILYLGDCPPYLRQIRQFRGRGDTPARGSIGHGGVYEGIWEVGV